MNKWLLGLLIGTGLGFLPGANAALFDWDLATNPAPNVWQENGITITVTPDANTTATNFSAFVASTPITGGVATPPNTLQTTNGNGVGTPDATPGFTVTVDFSGYGPVENVSMSLYDLQKVSSAFQKTEDTITNIQATLSGGGTESALSITPPGGATYTVTNSGSSLVSVDGNSANVATSANGNVPLAFGSKPVTEVQFTYTDADSHAPKAGVVEDLIALSNINYTPSAPASPEVGTWFGALTAVGLALGSRKFAATQI